MPIRLHRNYSHSTPTTSVLLVELRQYAYDLRQRFSQPFLSLASDQNSYFCQSLLSFNRSLAVLDSFRMTSTAGAWFSAGDSFADQLSDAIAHLASTFDFTKLFPLHNE